jgi:hypothetical protein
MPPTASAPGDDWFPIRLAFRDGEWEVESARLGAERFRDPFFHETVRRCLERPFNLAFRRRETFEHFEGQTCEGRRPDLLVFHLSRCGSTLVPQAFGALPDALAISEAGPIDEAVRADRFDPRADDSWKVRVLRAFASRYGRFAAPDAPFVIKLDAWHTLALPLFAQTFPDVPRIFVYRDPIEILVSHERRFAWMTAALNAPSLLGIGMAEAMAMDRHEYRAQLLARIASAFLEHAQPGDLLVNYEELPEALWDRIAPAAGVPASAEPALRAAAERDAKAPDRAFVPDSESKRREAGDAIRAACARWTQESYRELERRRRVQRAIPGGAA